MDKIPEQVVRALADRAEETRAAAIEIRRCVKAGEKVPGDLLPYLEYLERKYCWTGSTDFDQHMCELGDDYG